MESYSSERVYYESSSGLITPEPLTHPTSWCFHFNPITLRLGQLSHCSHVIRPPPTCWWPNSLGPSLAAFPELFFAKCFFIASVVFQKQFIKIQTELRLLASIAIGFLSLITVKNSSLLLRVNITHHHITLSCAFLLSRCSHDALLCSVSSRQLS